MCPKWFVKFHAGDFSLDDASRSGRPVDTETLLRIKLYHVGDSRHTKKIQINKGIGENEKCVFCGKK